MFALETWLQIHPRSPSTAKPCVSRRFCIWIPKPGAQQGQATQCSPRCGLKGRQKAWHGVRGKDVGEGK